MYEAKHDDPIGLLAQWDVGLYGRDWIEKFVRQGKARRVPDHFFGPSRYIMSAKDILPILLEGMPYVLDKNGMDASSLEGRLYFPDKNGMEGTPPFGSPLINGTFNLQKISQCPLVREILITGWDMS